MTEIAGWISEALSDIDEVGEIGDTMMIVPVPANVVECAIAFPPYEKIKLTKLYLIKTNSRRG